VAGSYEHGSELSGSIRAWEFVDRLATVSFSKRNLFPCLNYIVSSENTKILCWKPVLGS
jgi:hypothetical protein